MRAQERKLKKHLKFRGKSLDWCAESNFPLDGGSWWAYYSTYRHTLSKIWPSLLAQPSDYSTLSDTQKRQLTAMVLPYLGIEDPVVLWTQSHMLVLGIDWDKLYRRLVEAIYFDVGPVVRIQTLQGFWYCRRPVWKRRGKPPIIAPTRFTTRTHFVALLFRRAHERAILDDPEYAPLYRWLKGPWHDIALALVSDRCKRYLCWREKPIAEHDLMIFNTDSIESSWLHLWVYKFRSMWHPVPLMYVQERIFSALLTCFDGVGLKTLQWGWEEHKEKLEQIAKRLEDFRLCEIKID